MENKNKEIFGCGGSHKFSKPNDVFPKNVASNTKPHNYVGPPCPFISQGDLTLIIKSSDPLLTRVPI